MLKLCVKLTRLEDFYAAELHEKSTWIYAH